MFKNTASQKLIAYAFDSTTNLPKTGDAANLTAYVSKDYGTVTVLGDTSATEMDSTNAKGYYLFDLTQAETNGDCLLFSAKSSTANIVVLGMPAVVFTTPASFTSFVTPPTVAAIATGVWTDTTAGDFTTALSVGKSLMNGVTLGTGLTVARCTLTDTLTTYTGNTVQTGDAFSRIGVAGVGLTNLGDIRIANLDATISSRTKPADTQAAVTTVTTTTNLTNAPTAGDFTATMKTSIGTAVAASAVASVTGAVGSVTGNVGGTVAVVTTLTNLPAVPTDWLTAAGVKADAVTKIQAGLSTYAGGAVASVTGNVGGNVTGSVGSVLGAVGSVTGNVGGIAGTTQTLDALQTALNSAHGSGSWATATSVTVSDKTGFKLASDGIDAVVVETGVNARQALAIIGAITAGKLSGVESGDLTFYAMSNPTTTRVTAVVTSGNDRETVTLTPPA